MPDISAPPPDAESLYQAALSYLARYSATRASLRRTLLRRVDRWARSQTDAEAAEQATAAARAAIDAIIERLVRTGIVNDAAFAEARARGLTRAGKSARSIQVRLIGKGVAPDLAREAATTDPDSELAAALVLARRRRVGPYRTTPDPDAAEQARELGVLARAGFSRDVSERALAMPQDEAERRIHDLRR